MFWKKYERPPSIPLRLRMRRFAKQHPEILSYQFSTWAVGVKGDMRVYEPSIIITTDQKLSKEIDKISELSTKITNEVPGISRVLWEIK